MFFPKKSKKSLGQNFLIDKNIIKKIVELGNIGENKNILEIGPGYGSLTQEILKIKPKNIIAIEKDKKLSLYLKDIFKNNESIKIINDDIFNIIKNESFNQNVIVFGNLPYNISTQILTSLVVLKKWPPWYDLLILMFQKEVADRIIAKNSNRLAILCNWRLEIKKHFDVSKNCFFPKPKINSTILSFKPRKNTHYKIKDPKNLEKITRVLFSAKRKMINKNFSKLFKNHKAVARELNLNLNLRPQNLSNEMFYKITMMYEKLLG